MKKILLLWIFWFPSYLFSQFYGTLSPQAWATDENLKFGITASAGQIVSNGLTIGFGAGLIFFDEGNPYVPIFAELGYYQPQKKVSPYFNVRAGYGIYDGGGQIIDKKLALKGGFFSDIRGGAGFKLSPKVGIIPFVAASPMTFQWKFSNQKENFSKLFFSFGTAFIFN